MADASPEKVRGVFFGDSKSQIWIWVGIDNAMGNNSLQLKPENTSAGAA